MLETLRRIVQEVSSTEDFHAALKILVERVRDAVNTQACSVFLIDDHVHRYILTATVGLNESSVGKVSLGLDEGLIGLVGQREEPINIEDAHSHPNFFHSPEVQEERFRAFLGVPIIHHRKLYGVLIIQQEAMRRFAEEEVAFLVTMAAQLAGVIAPAHATGKLHQILQQSNIEQAQQIRGIAAVAGIGIGTAFVAYNYENLYKIPERTCEDVSAEIIKFQNALKAAHQEFEFIRNNISFRLREAEHGLFDVYIKMLEDPAFQQEVILLIQQKSWAPGAIAKVIKSHIREFEWVEDPYLRERSEDILYLGHSVLKHLRTQKTLVKREYPDQTILIGEEISPTNIAEIPEEKLRGIISGKGSHNSHVAILARAMGIPTVMGIKGITSAFEGQTFIVDGSQGHVWIKPSKKLLQQYSVLAEQRRTLEDDLQQLRDLPAVTLDNHSITLFVNAGLGEDASTALRSGAEGIGLFRTEIPFMMRDRFPTEEEQYVLYRQILKTLAPRPVIMRMLDVGGDKSLPYFSFQEDNPFLGWRGIRLTLDHPEVFLAQVRAMLRANLGLNNLRIMLPMVSKISEVTSAKKLIQKALKELNNDGFDLPLPPLGVMIEVPAAVYQANLIAKEVDFLSVGSNDLSQYILAVDRNNDRVAMLYDSLHPAILQALLQTVESAHQEGKKISICGEMVSDPLALIALIAMDFDALSVSANQIPRTKWLIRNIEKSYAKELLQQILNFSEASTIRKHLRLALIELGLGRLIRLG